MNLSEKRLTNIKKKKTNSKLYNPKKVIYMLEI